MLNLRKGWLEVSEHEIGRPHRRAMNPIPNPVMPDNTQPTGAAQLLGLELLRWDLYDYSETEVNTTPVKETMFSQPTGAQYIPAGGASFQKNLLHTNLQSQGAVLPNPQRFVAKGLSMIVRADIFIGDIVPLMFETLGQFTVGDSNKPYFIGLLGKLPCMGAGIHGASSVGATAPAGVTQGSALVNGWPIAENFYRLLADDSDPGVPINQGQNFAFIQDPTLQIGGWSSFQIATGKTATSGTGGTGIHFWINLVGALARAIQ